MNKVKTIAPANASVPRPVSDGTAGNPHEVRVEKQSSSSMKEIGGSGFELWDNSLLHRTAGTFAALTFEGESNLDVQKRNAGLAGLALRSFKPTDEVEAMIAAQATMLHAMSMECARRAMTPQQHPDEASKLRKDAANSARAMIEMCEALDRRRGKGTRQIVRVERVVVNEGGQAIVGPVTAGVPMVRALGQGDAPMQASPIAASDTREGVEA